MNCRCRLWLPYGAIVYRYDGEEPETVWCTCGIDEVPSIPDPRLAWRHKSFCAHALHDNQEKT